MISHAAQHRFDSLYERLVVAGVQRQIGGQAASPTFTEQELSFLLSAASRLALEDDDIGSTGTGRTRAYEIATRTMDFVGEDQEPLLDAAGMILARLGNFPARALLDERRPRAEFSLPPYLELEALARETENTVHIREDIGVPVTDFQVRLLGALERSGSVSVSAPTSAGKSFALSLDVVRRFQTGKRISVVYLVPTRALIRQVMYDTIEQMNEHKLGHIPVLCVPELLGVENAPRGAIYVLTQERLMSLLYPPGATTIPKVDVLIVDEAQEIGDDGRGFVLETVVERTLRSNPRAAVFFSSPLKSNPGYLLGHFGRPAGEFFVEPISPVTQTLISVFRVKGKPERASIHVAVGSNDVKVAELPLDFKFRPGAKYLQKIATTFTKHDECSIVYVNGAAAAESLAQELPSSTEVNEQVQDLIDFIREHVHPKYRLADCLEQGVAFHYGRMPQILRARVEDLLKDRSLRFVCCTSTLLQGVNLPAKNIFIENPKRGKGKPMGSGDFWNLVGRAGRLKKEFHGNVWCIYGRDWDTDPRAGDRLEQVSSAFTRTLESEPEGVLRAIKNPDGPAESEDRQLYEQAFGRVFSDFSLQGRPVTAIKSIPESKRPVVAEIEKICAEIVTNSSLPADVFVRNATISPLKLEQLGSFLSNQRSLAAWVPVVPFSKEGYASMKAIFGKLEDVFFREGNESYVYYCWLRHSGWAASR